MRKSLHCSVPLGFPVKILYEFSVYPDRAMAQEVGRGLSPGSIPVHVEFVNKVATEKIFHQLLQFYPCQYHPTHAPYLQYSSTYHAT